MVRIKKRTGCAFGVPCIPFRFFGCLCLVAKEGEHFQVVQETTMEILDYTGSAVTVSGSHAFTVARFGYNNCETGLDSSSAQPGTALNQVERRPGILKKEAPQ
jgi:hypothetical protein